MEFKTGINIALAQINPIVGDIRSNTKKIISLIKKTNAELLVFPELAITGYSPQDLLLNRNFIMDNVSALKRVVENTMGKSAIVGFADYSGNAVYNSAAVIQNKKLIGIHHKICLPNYSVFDEKRWFAKGCNPATVNLYGTEIGVNICEDIWHPKTASMQKTNRAELIINISASPYSKGKIKAVESILKKRWEEIKIPIIYVNQAGAQDGMVYFGHSMCINGGKIGAKCANFEEDLKIITWKKSTGLWF